MPYEKSPFDDEFDAIVQRELEKWKAPGLSIAIIHGPDTYTKVRPLIPLDLHHAHGSCRHMGRQNCQIPAQTSQLER